MKIKDHTQVFFSDILNPKQYVLVLWQESYLSAILHAVKFTFENRSNILLYSCYYAAVHIKA